MRPLLACVLLFACACAPRRPDAVVDLFFAAPDAKGMPDLGAPDLAIAGPDLSPPACGADDDCPPTSICRAGTCSPGCSAAHPCAAGVCEPVTSLCVPCVADTDCPATSICYENGCASGCSRVHPCTGGLACCSSTCVDFGSDRDNCGQCGRACANGVACTLGVCQ